MGRFSLYRADSSSALILEQRIGEFDCLDDARRAREWDVLRQLERTGCTRVELGHAIVDAIGGAPRRMVCCVGQPPGELLDPAAELAATAAWLARGRRA